MMRSSVRFWLWASKKLNEADDVSLFGAFCIIAWCCDVFWWPAFFFFFFFFLPSIPSNGCVPCLFGSLIKSRPNAPAMYYSCPSATPSSIDPHIISSCHILNFHLHSLPVAQPSHLTSFLPPNSPTQPTHSPHPPPPPKPPPRPPPPSHSDPSPHPSAHHHTQTRTPSHPHSTHAPP